MGRTRIVFSGSVLVVLLGACTGGGQSPPSSAPISSVEGSSATPRPGEDAADSEASDAELADREPELPRLPDIVIEPSAPSTRSEELAGHLAEVDELSQMTPQIAVDIVGLLLPELPGQTPTDLPAGDGLGDSSTLEIANMFRDRFSVAQQEIVDEYIEAGTVVATFHPDGTITRPEAAVASAARGLRDAAAPPVAEYEAILQNVFARWDAHLPDHPPITVDLSFAPPGTPNPHRDGMDAYTEDGLCRIRVLPIFWTETTVPADRVAFVFAHEVFHCYQNEWEHAGGGPAHSQWLVEGGAEWAAADLFRGTGDASWLHRAWYTKPDAELSNRTYSAWPLWEHARQTGHDVYRIMQAMLSDDQPSVGQNLAAAGLDDLTFRMLWSSTATRTPEWGTEWAMPWPLGDPAHATVPTLIPADRGPGTYNILGDNRYGHVGHHVTMVDVDLVRVTPSGGPLMTVARDGTVTVSEGDTGVFCFAAHECACPGGTAVGIPMASPAMVFSFAAAVDASSAAVSAEEWDDDECDEPRTRPAGHSDGDPHLTTFDGLSYDVMTLGEFVLVRDPAGDLEVQTRHVPIAGAAGTSAVAVGVGEHRVTFTNRGLDDTVTVVRVDGEVVDPSGGDVGDARFDGGADGRWSVTWPDGSVVRLRWFSGWFVEVEVPAERATRMVGLLGSFDHDLTNDLLMSDGSVVVASAAAVDESPFVLQWSVDDRSSLFDYAPGESASTYRIPHPDPNPASPSAEIVRRCADALGELATTGEVDACAFDVAATGDERFVTVYGEVTETRRSDDGDRVVVPELAADDAATSSDEPSDSRAGAPTLTLGGDRLEGAVEVVAGSVLVARTELCPAEANVDIEVRSAGDPDLLARAALCDPGALAAVGADEGEWFDGEAYVWLPADGGFEVVIAALGFGVEIGAVDIYTDPTPAVVDGGDLVDGDERVLTGIGDTVVYLTQPGTTFAASGFELACAVEVYWGQTFPHPEPFDLVRCEHSDVIDFPPTDMVFPVVAFARTAEPIDIELVPTGG